MEENSEVKKTKVNRTWLLIAGLIILTIILLVVSLTSKSFSPLKSAPKNVKVDIAHTSLSISEPIQSGTGEFEANININTNGDDISGAQIELSFDPKILTNVDITPGEFINQPTVLIKTVDTKNGVIRYALAIKPGNKMVKGEGRIAKITFTKTGNQTTYLNFLPQSQVSTTSHNQSLLRETVSAVITGASITGTTSPTVTQDTNQ